MKTKSKLLTWGVITISIFAFTGCSNEEFNQNSNGQLIKIRTGDYISEVITYNQDNLVEEVNSTMFYRRFHYDQNLKLIKEEVAISPDSYSSSIRPGSTHEFVDPDKTGISMYYVFEYDVKNRPSEQRNYIPKKGVDEYRSKSTFEYNTSDLISKELLYNSDNEVTQFRTYLYDDSGNVIEEGYFTYLFIAPGTGPKQLSKITYEYDSYKNPFIIFRQSARPGIYTNTNNIVRTKTIQYDPAPGLPAVSETTTSYEYNRETGYPIRVVGGEEYIYE